MMSDFQCIIESFDPLIASDEFCEAYYEFYAKLFAEINPDDQLPSRKLFKKYLRDSHPHHVHNRWLAFPKGNQEEIIGCGHIAYETEESPSYKNNCHIMHGGVSVARDYRQRGIGGKLLRTLVDKTKELGKTTFEAGATLEVGHRFCRKLKATKALEEVENRLVLGNVNWQMVKQWRAEGLKRSQGVNIEIFRVIPEKDVEMICGLLNEVVNQQPLGKIESRFKATPESLRLNEKSSKDKGVECLTMITRERDGVISGITTRYFSPEESYRIDIGFTGVKLKYRERGLGKWLKAEMLLYIKENYPTVKYEVTGNATTNVQMQSINERLGFKVHSRHIAYTFNVTELDEKLRGK